MEGVICLICLGLAAGRVHISLFLRRLPGICLPAESVHAGLPLTAVSLEGQALHLWLLAAVWGSI